MNVTFSSNLVRPNLPLRKPSSSPVLPPCAASPSSGLRATLLQTPVHPASDSNGSFLSPGSPMVSPVSSINHSTPLTVKFCNFCGQQGNFRCKRCKKTAYCSVVCQTEDWKAHRHMCKAIEAEPAKENTLEGCVSPVLGGKPADSNHSDTSSIQRVYMKDLHSNVIKGTEMQAAVVEFHSPGHFFIVAQSNEILEALHTITTELQKTYSIPTATIHTPVVDEVCAVQYSCDMNWYRGLMENVAADQNTAHVLYIDFGNEEDVPFERIKPLTANLQQFNPCAIECCIAEVVSAADAWSGKCCIAVRQLLEGKMVTVRVLDTMENSRVHAVDIVLSMGNTLSSFLLEHEYAVKEAVKRTPSEQDINAMINASMENFKCHSVGKDDNSWAQVPEPLTQAVGDSFLVVVTHLQSPEKIVVQKVDNAGVIQDLQMKLRDHCSQVPASSTFRPAPGTVCCALFSEDKQWYRAKILAYSSEERVCVGYLDFGNSEDVVLSNLRPITQSLLDVPMQAMTCGLAGVQPVGVDWSEECLLAFQRRVSNRILHIEIQGPQEGKALVKLVDEASDPQANIAELLISAGYAAPAVINGNHDQPMETLLSAPEVPEVCSPVPEPLVWTCAELPPEGQTVSLRVCCVESPGKFFCHIDNPKDLELLIALEAELMAYFEAESSTFTPKLGEPCCAIISENGKCFRALVKQLCEDEVMVALVDYGYYLNMKKGHLRSIKAKFLTLPFLALPCWLAGVEPQGSEWTSEALLWFQTLVEGEALSARVLSITEDGYGVELQSKGQSVAAALVSEHLAKYPGEKGKQDAASTPNIQNESILEKKVEQAPNNPEQIPEASPAKIEAPSFPADWKTVVLPFNETFRPCIAAVSSPSLFYLFGPRQVGVEQLQEMMLQLAEYCNSQVSQPSESVQGKPAAGAACCARFTVDNNWYRAVILEVCGQEASVIYADYGNSEKVSLSSILPIPASFLQLPFQVTRCTLVGKDHFPAEWSEPVLQMFPSALQQDVLATVQSFDGYSNMLSLSLPSESGGGLVEAMILDSLQAHSKSTTAPVPDLTPVSSVSNADSTTETSPEPCVAPDAQNKCEALTTTQEVQPPMPPAPLGKSAEAVHENPVQRILKHMEPPCTTDPKTQEALASNCCCQSLKNKIDQLEQIMQVQLSLIKKLIAHTK